MMYKIKAYSRTPLLLALPFLVLLCLASISLPQALAVTANDTSCGFMNNNITLSSHLNQSAANCINLNASNVILNCNGFNITGNISSNQVGINITGFSNVTVIRCRIDKFVTGIFLSTGNNISIENNTIFNGTTGISASTGTPRDVWIYNNTVLNMFGGSGTGITVNGRNITVLGNFINNSGSLGISLGGTSGFSRIINNTVAIAGFEIQGGVDNYLIDSNTVVHPSSANTGGIRLLNGAKNDTITNNIINLSGGNANTAGITIGTNTVSNITVANNTFYNCPNTAISVNNGGGGIVFDNDVENNTILTTCGIGIAIGGGSILNRVRNNLINMTGASTGISVTSSNNNTLMNNTIIMNSSLNSLGLSIASSKRLNLNQSNITAKVSLLISATNGSTPNPEVYAYNTFNGTINFTDSRNYTFINNNFFNSSINVVFNSSVILFQNTTGLNQNALSAASNSSFLIQWFDDIQVIDNTTLSPLANSSVNVTDLNGVSILNALTDANGGIFAALFNQSVINATGQFNQTPHNFSVSALGYTSIILPFSINGSFIINMSLLLTPPAAGGGGGGGGRVIAGHTGELCAEGWVLYGNKCVECAGTVIERDGSLVCRTCPEGMHYNVSIDWCDQDIAQTLEAVPPDVVPVGLLSGFLILALIYGYLKKDKSEQEDEEE